MQPHQRHEQPTQGVQVPRLGLRLLYRTVMLAYLALQTLLKDIITNTQHTS